MSAGVLGPPAGVAAGMDEARRVIPVLLRVPGAGDDLHGRDRPDVGEAGLVHKDAGGSPGQGSPEVQEVAFEQACSCSRQRRKQPLEGQRCFFGSRGSSV